MTQMAELSVLLFRLSGGLCITALLFMIYPIGRKSENLYNENNNIGIESNFKERGKTDE